MRSLRTCKRLVEGLYGWTDLTVMRYFCIDLSHDSSSNFGSTNEVTPQNAGPKMSNRPIVGMHVNSWTKTHVLGI